MQLGAAHGNGAVDPLKVGERFGAARAMPIPSQAPAPLGPGTV